MVDKASDMDIEERTLYHQIHPVKLVTDWVTGIIGLYFFWKHHLSIALIVAVVPSMVVSFLIIQFVDLQNYKKSRFGKYIHRYMNMWVDSARLMGYAIMAVGAWYHATWLIIPGLFMIFLAWFHGVIFHFK